MVAGSKAQSASVREKVALFSNTLDKMLSGDLRASYFEMH